jgi:hypothetical protein
MKKSLKEISIAVLATSFVVVFGFFLLEPSVTMAVENQFTITQGITGEISFLTPASDVTMTSLGGIVGGTSTGQTQVIVVLTNNNAGYTMTIKASSSPAMQGNTQGGTIDDYTPSAVSVPDFTWHVPFGYEFGYSVSASTTADTVQKFLDDGTKCDTGSLDTSKGGDNGCWYGLSTSATSTVVRSSATAPSGATSTIYFRLTVNPNTVPVEDTYVATTTLTATMN